MGFWDSLLGRSAPQQTPEARPDRRFAVQSRMSAADFSGSEWDGFIRNGLSMTGAVVNAKTVLRNASVYRCVTLISNAIGMLPCQLMKSADATGETLPAREHPLYDVLAGRPNEWQTAFEFRRLMQHRVLTKGNAYALPIVSRGAVRQLIPIDPDRVKVSQAADWSVSYEVTRKDGGRTTYTPDEIFHVMGPSECGLRGLALVDFAGEVLGLALRAQESAARIFREGVAAGGALSTDQKLSPEAIANLKDSLANEFSGAENVGKWMVLEQGLEAKPFGTTSKDAQNVEQRAHQVEEIARIFGVPRPFLMVDDTSWGSGIEQLGIYFVQYGLAPHFVAWEQAISRSLLTASERTTHFAKFNERALLRGSMKDQSEFFARALGSGGAPAWMTQDEVRKLSDLPPKGAEAETLSMGMAAKAGGTQ